MMADELRYRTVITVSDADLPNEPPFDTSNVSSDMATAVIERGVQVVGTTAEVLRLGDVSAAGRMAIRNLDGTNFVQVGKMVSAAFEAYDDILPGETGLVRPPSGVTLYVKADTAEVKISRFIPST